MRKIWGYIERPFYGMKFSVEFEKIRITCLNLSFVLLLRNNVQYANTYNTVQFPDNYALHASIPELITEIVHNNKINTLYILSIAIKGPTERNFLVNITQVVEAALPTNKLCSYLATPSAEDYLLKKIGFCEEMKLVWN